ncbi:hypothetical protein GCM10027048_25480 [Hymenobacter coalescens]
MSADISSADRQRLRALFGLRRPELAEQALRRLLQQHPQSVWLHGMLAWAHYQQDQWPAAREAAATAVALNPEYSYAHYLLGLVALAEGRLGLAAVSLTEARRLDPLAANYQTAQGMLYYAQQRYGEALDALAEALALNPTATDAWRFRHAALVGLERYAEAEQTARQWLRLEPQHHLAQQAAGQAALRRKDYAAARQHLAEALRLQPDWPGAKRDLAQALKGRFRLWRWLDAGYEHMQRLYERGRRGNVLAWVAVLAGSVVVAYLCVPLLLLHLGVYLRWRLDPQVRHLLQSSKRRRWLKKTAGTQRGTWIWVLTLSSLLGGLICLPFNDTWGYRLLGLGLVVGIIAERFTDKSAD